MALIAGLAHTLASYVSPAKPLAGSRPLTPPESESWSSTTSKDRGHSSDHSDLDGDTLTQTSAQRKRGRSETRPILGSRRKKQKNQDEDYLDEFDSGEDFEGATLLTSTPPQKSAKYAISKEEADRLNMPPPATPKYDTQNYRP